MRVAHVSIWLLLICRVSSAQTLPGTVKLDWSDEDLSTRLMDGAHRFVERKIDESEGKRAQFWNHDFSTAAAYENSVAPNRDRLRTIMVQDKHSIRPTNHDRSGLERLEMFLETNRTRSRTTTAVRRREGLVQVDVNDVDADVAGTRMTHDRVGVRAVAVDQTTT